MDKEPTSFLDALVPLKLGGRRNKFFRHPAYPGKIIRHAREHNHPAEAAFHDRYQQRELAALKDDYGISHLSYELITKPVMGREPPLDVFAVVDYVADGVGFDEIMKGANVEVADREEMAEEIDFVAARLLDYIRDKALNGGIINKELLGLTQFLYAPSRPRGERFVLADVDPYAHVLKKPEANVFYANEWAAIGELLRRLTVELLLAEQAVGRTFLARHELERAVDVLPTAIFPAIDHLRQDILHSLEINDPTPVIEADMENGEDEMQSAYWYMFDSIETEPLPSVTGFKSRQAAEDYIQQPKK